MKFLRNIFLLLSFFACEKEEALTLCNSEDPVHNMEWLRNTTIDIQSDPKYFSVIISVFDYQGQTIFNIQDIISSCAFCDLRDCSGQKFTPSDFNDLMTNKKNERKVWCQNPDLCVN